MGLKGRTVEEIHGPEKAQAMRARMVAARKRHEETKERDKIKVRFGHLTTPQLEDILLDLGGRKELSLRDVRIYYAASDELERRRYVERDR